MRTPRGAWTPLWRPLHWNIVNQELVSDHWLEMQRAEDAEPFPRHSSWLPATGELMILGHMGCLSTSSSQAGETWEKRINGTSTTKLRCTRTSLRNSSALCFWEALSLSACSLTRFPFPMIFPQPGQTYLLYLSPVVIQLTEILEPGT